MHLSTWFTTYGKNHESVKASVGVWTKATGMKKNQNFF